MLTYLCLLHSACEQVGSFDCIHNDIVSTVSDFWATDCIMQLDDICGCATIPAYANNGKEVIQCLMEQSL
jgi:hypothetical protein